MTSTGFCKHHANLTTECIAQHQRNLIRSTLCLHAPNLPYACDIETPRRLLEPHQMNTRIEKKNGKRCTPEPDEGQWGPNETFQNHCTYPSVKQSISAQTLLQSVDLCVGLEKGGISWGRSHCISYRVPFSLVSMHPTIKNKYISIL